MAEFMWYEDPHKLDSSKFTPRTWCDHRACAGRSLPRGEGGDEFPINICLNHLKAAVAFAETFGPLYEAVFGARPESTQRPSPHHAAGRSIVYYLRFGDRIKIGVTANLQTRLTALPHDVVLAVEWGDRTVEAARHQQFAHLRATGEWFHPAVDLQAHIDQLGAETPEILAEHFVSIAVGNGSDADQHPASSRTTRC